MALAQVRLELARQVARVLLAALKEDARARVGGECLPGARAELPQVLVGEHEPEVVAPSFHQHVIEALGQVQVVLELVQVEIEIGPLGLRLRCSGEDCLP